MIKAIIFDYFGVVSSDEYWDTIGVESNESEQRFHALSDKVNKGELSWGDFCIQLAEMSGKSTEEINNMYKKHRLNRALITMIAQLKKNYKTGLLSNASKAFVDPLFKEAHLDKVFDSIVVSSEVGSVKPQKEIYHYACRQLHVEPEEALFFDDIEVNVDGAKAAGLSSYLYQDNESLLKQFSKLNLRL